MASDEQLSIMADYDGCLLEKAFDAGSRMLPAFSSPTGMPSVCRKANLVPTTRRILIFCMQCEYNVALD